MSRRLFTAAAALGAGALLLSACATGTAVDPGSNDPDAVEQGGAQEMDVDAAWLNGGSAIGVITWGSSSCVPTAEDVTVEADGTLAITMTDAATAETPCTMDMAPRATMVSLPDGVDATKDLDIVVTLGDAIGETDLDAATNIPADFEEFSPSAGWTDIDGVYVVLTWGSSTCVPVVMNSEVTGADEVTLEFQAAPADKPCTMDMAPRLNLADAPGVKDNGQTMLTITGDGEFATPVTVPILGS